MLDIFQFRAFGTEKCCHSNLSGIRHYEAFHQSPQFQRSDEFRPNLRLPLQNTSNWNEGVIKWAKPDVATNDGIKWWGNPSRTATPRIHEGV